VSTSELKLLSVDLPTREHVVLREFCEKPRQLSIGLGSHHLPDLSWAARLLEPRQGMWALDAGAGVGPMQWWLAERRVNVLNVGRALCHDMPLRLRAPHSVGGFGNGDFGSSPAPRLGSFRPPRSPRCWYRHPEKVVDSFAPWPSWTRHRVGRWAVFIFWRAPTETRDVAGLLRVLRPGKKLGTTFGATKDGDWLHERPKMWCLTKATLHRALSLPSDCPSNFGNYDWLSPQLRNSLALRSRLDKLCFLSGDNGTLGGVWDPKCMPVGVMRTK
jgi:hypothetical protein